MEPPALAPAALSKRERQIMDAIYARGQATAAEVLSGIDDPPGYSAIRALLRVLETKGHVVHRRDGARYVYVPTVARDAAGESALRRVVDTFFSGSVETVVATLLSGSETQVTEAELDRLEELIRRARDGGR